MRIKKITADGTTIYHYDPAGNVLSEDHPDGSKTDYVYLNGKLLAKVDVNVELAEEVVIYHTDFAGTPLAMSDASGQKIWEADYKPFGEEFTVEGNSENDRRFVGKEKDEETGLNYFGARYLSAQTGRFLAPDPVRAVDAHNGELNPLILSDPQRQNCFAYALNNPYKFTDPDGDFPLVLIPVVYYAIPAFICTVYIAKAFIETQREIKKRSKNPSVNDPALSTTDPENKGKYHLPPDTIEGIPDLEIAKPKTPVQGGGGLRKRWKDKKGKIYEWDSRHGALEKFDKHGKHLGEYDPKTGKQTKPPKNGRKVKP